MIVDRTAPVLDFASFNRTRILREEFSSRFITIRRIKKLIWIYFFLLIFEGALRKWILPGLSTPLLIIRDPFAFFIILLALQQRLVAFSVQLAGMMFIGCASVVTAFYLGHGSLAVALYGSRILLLHFPLIFIIGSVFNNDDVVKMGRAVLLISLPMIVLIALQFYSPQSAWVNRGVGGDIKGAGFSGALGFFRPPGTFSFTNGNTLFFSLLAPFIFYFWLFPKYINKFLLIAATMALLAAIPFSISRTLFFSVVVSSVFAIIVSSKKSKIFNYLIVGSIIAFILTLFQDHLSFVQTATKAFTARFEGANKSEGGLSGVLGDRYFGGMFGAFLKSNDFPFFGYGSGFGTSVGGTLLLGKAGLNIAEDEWTRNIGELGLLMGTIVILIRLGLCINMARASLRKIRQNNILPWMLLSFVLLNIPQGQWAQPTALGFSILSGGLLLAALKK